MNGAEIRERLGRINKNFPDVWNIYGKQSEVKEMITYGDAIAAAFRALAERQAALEEIIKLIESLLGSDITDRQAVETIEKIARNATGGK